MPSLRMIISLLISDECCVQTSGAGILLLSSTNHFFEFLHGQWPTEQVALVSRAACCSEKMSLRVRFHPLGDYCQPQTLTEGNHCAGNGCIIGVFQQVTDKGLINLQLVQR